MHTALRATSLTLRDFLQNEFEMADDLRPFFHAGSGGTMRVSLMTPEEMSVANLLGLSLWLYRVCRDEQTLNARPERISRDQIRPPPLPMRLHYLMTPIASGGGPGGSETEQVILGKVLQLFHDKPQLRGAELRDDFVGTSREISMRLEALSLDEITRVWDALEGSYQLSISYEVTAVAIDSALVPERVSPVLDIRPEPLVRAT